jgi:hypothetical protein
VFAFAVSCDRGAKPGIRVKLGAHSEYLGDELGQMRFRIERELRPIADDE